jgi:hypothetical protein
MNPLIQAKLERLWNNPLLKLIQRFYLFSLVPYFGILFFSWVNYDGMVWLAKHYDNVYTVIIIFLSIMSYLSIPVFIYVIVLFFTFVYFGGGDIMGCCWACFCVRRSDKIRQSWEDAKSKKVK